MPRKGDVINDIINELDRLATRVRGLLWEFVGRMGDGRVVGGAGEEERRWAEGMKGGGGKEEESYEAANLIRMMVKVWPLLPPVEQQITTKDEAMTREKLEGALLLEE